jgi:hypothetical protein
VVKKSRDDFTLETRRRLASRAGWICSFPGCRAHTIGATGDSEGVIDIGTAAHICAAAPGGPRYDATMSSQDRASVNNGIWMCRDHGKAIDSTDSRFTVEQLREWKGSAEAESRRRVLRGESGALSPAQLSAHLRASAAADLEVFRRTGRWPPTSVALTLKVDGFEESVSTGALARVVTSLDDLMLVAPPGMGKTTTLFQIATGLLEVEHCAPIFVSLGDWATEGTSILDSVLKRPAFQAVPETDLRLAAGQPGVVLLLDGWNELDAKSRNRARVEIATLKAQHPAIGLIVSTRRQALDVPIEAMRIDLLPLSEAQQEEISIALRGDSGARILDQAWRTAGVRELVAIPLYLTALLLRDQALPFPKTKDEVIRHFADSIEKDAAHAEALLPATRGFQQAYLDGLSTTATRAGNTSIADASARRSILETARELVAECQLNIAPMPDDVLDVLVSSHVLVRAGGDAPGYAFQHQQFQEWYASHSVERRIVASGADAEARADFQAEILNFPAWEEAILFAVERLARGDGAHQSACSGAILAAFEVDPILAAEMIFRATDDVWSKISATVLAMISRWHAAGKVDRALRFMLTSGRPEFLDAVWPIITAESDQLSLAALRNCRQFRPSILGKEAEARIKALPTHAREVILHEMASNSGMDGLDLSTAIAKEEGNPEVQLSVIEALAFRRADRHVTEILTTADDKLFDLIVAKGILNEVPNEAIEQRLLAARVRRTEADQLSPIDRLRQIVRLPEPGDRDEEVSSIVSTMEIDAKMSAMQWILQAGERFPKAVAEAILLRVREDRPLFYGADGILSSSGFSLEDESLLEVALATSDKHDLRADAAASVLGPRTTGQMIDALLGAGARLRAKGKYDPSEGENYHRLKVRIAHAPAASLIAAVLDRSPHADNDRMARMAELLSRESREIDRGRAFDAAAVVAIQDLVEDWGTRMLASSDATREQKATIARLASHVQSVRLLPILTRLLDDNLKRYRAFRVEAAAANWRPCSAVTEAQHPMMHEYMRAFSVIRSPETADLMTRYLSDLHFGDLAAHVLSQQWIAANEPPADRRFGGGVDLSSVKSKRASRLADPHATSTEAEAIFAVVDSLLVETRTKEEEKLAVAIGAIASRLPHGQRPHTVQKLIDVAPRRIRSTLLLNLVLSGDEVSSAAVTGGIAETFDAAKTQPWILTQGEGFELKEWLRLLPFVDRPSEMLAVVAGLPPDCQKPDFLSAAVVALADAPSQEGEGILFRLAERDPRFYSDSDWRTTALRFGSESAALRLVDLAGKGLLGQRYDAWPLVSQLAGLLDRHEAVRLRVYAILKNEPMSDGLSILARAVSENPDPAGLLLLLEIQGSSRQSFVNGRTLEAVVTERVSSESWKGAYEVVPIHSVELRRELLARTTDGGASDVAARWLRAIDSIRDEYGAPEWEGRHPDLSAKKTWPILTPDMEAEGGA